MNIPEGWTINYNPKPIPSWCRVDYDFWHENCDSENALCGNGPSVEACIEMIKDIESNS